MKNLLTLTFILLFTFTFTSCSDDTPTSGGQSLDTSSFTYPSGTGSSWNITRKFSAENIRPDSIRHYFTQYPLIFNGSVNISTDTVINGVSAKCFVETETENSFTFESRLYYRQTDSGFYCAASRGQVIIGMPFKKGGKIILSKNGFKSDNPLILMNAIKFGKDIINGDSLIIYDPPLLSVKYPVIRGIEWEFANFSHPISKKYIDFETININGSNISCIKTKITHQVSDDLVFYEYYSKYGEMKSDYLYKDMLVTTMWNPDGVGYVDMRQVIDVTSYNIVNP